jgi:hypothetical protein
MVDAGALTVSFKEPTAGRDVVIFVNQVVAVTVMPNFKSTVVIGPGSTAIPVTGTVEEVVEKIKQAKAMSPGLNEGVR